MSKRNPKLSDLECRLCHVKGGAGRNFLLAFTPIEVEVLCAECDCGLNHFNNDPDVVAAAAQFLRGQ